MEQSLEMMPRRTIRLIHPDDVEKKEPVKPLHAKPPKNKKKKKGKKKKRKNKWQNRRRW